MNARPSVIEIGLYATLLLSILAFGAGFSGGYSLLELSVLVLGSALLLSRSWHQSLRFEKWVQMPIVLLVLWIAFLAFQLMLHDISFVQSVSPHLVALTEQYSVTPDTAIHQIPLTMSADRTWTEFAKALAYAAVFLIAFTMFHEKKSFKRLACSMVAIGFLVSLIGLLCHRFSPDKIYGFFSFDDVTSFSPYLNKNHFANLLVMTIPATLALGFLTLDRSSFSLKPNLQKKILWFSSREATWLYVLMGMFVIQVAALLSSASRGGLLGFGGAMVGFALLLTFRSRKKILPIAFLGFIGSIVAMGAYQVRPLIHKLRLLELSAPQDLALHFRLSNWADAIRIFFDFPVVGVGAGAFHELFPMYKSMPELSIFSQVRFYHVENEYLEALVETGLIGGSILLILGIFITIRFVRAWRVLESKTIKWVSMGVFSSVCGMLAHSLVDFPMHIPANMALYAVCGGVLARIGTGEIGMAQEVSVEKASIGTFRRVLQGSLALLSIVFVLSFSLPFLWSQWRTDVYFSEANDFLEEIPEREALERGSVLGAYEALLNAKKWGRSQGRISAGFGRVYAYFGMFEVQNSKKQEKWFQKAEINMIIALQKSPLNAQYQYSLGWLYEIWEKPDQAAPYIQNAVELEPQNPFYPFKWGQNQKRLGENDKAREAFSKTVGINRAYLESVLEFLRDFSQAVDISDLRGLIPNNEHREDMQHRMIQFFELNQNLKLAELIGQFG